MTSESDLEYIAVQALEFVWLLHGDEEYLRRYLPVAEKGIEYLTSDALRWDSETGLVKRGHTCDTWDFDIEHDGYRPELSSVAAICDQSGLFAAYQALARMNEYLGMVGKAATYLDKARLLRERCRDRFWDGSKYKHHIHINHLGHEGFDESEQLSMGNVWMMTRQAANSEESCSIISEYVNRLRSTGHAFPWWSLERGIQCIWERC